jgi:electron transport complex protein RnfG
MEKLKSSLPNMLLSLVIICMVAAGALAGVYLLTKKNIQQQKEQKLAAALKEVVLPDADASVQITVVSSDSVALTEQNKQDTAKLDTINICVVNVIALNGQVIGKAVETSAVGFGGKQKIMVGFDNEGKILNYKVLEHQETPGLGDHIADWFNDPTKESQCIIGRQATGNFKVNKDGGDVDAITAATISSRAFLKAVNHAWKAAQQVEGIEVEAVAGASQLHHEAEEVANDSIQVETANEETEVTNE